MQNTQKITIAAELLNNFLREKALTPARIFALGIEQKGEKVEIHFFPNDNLETKVVEKQTIPVVWTPGYAYLGNIQCTSARTVVVEAQAQFLNHKHAGKVLDAFQPMLERMFKQNKKIADIFLATPTTDLAVKVGTWKEITGFRLAVKGSQVACLRLVEQNGTFGILGVAGMNLVHANLEGEMIPTDERAWTVAAEHVDGQNELVFLGRANHTVVATSIGGRQVALNLETIMKNRQAKIGGVAEDASIFYGPVAGTEENLAYLTREKDQAQLTFAPAKGKHAPAIAAQLQ